MEERFLTVVSGFERKLGNAYQLNLIEMIGYIYLNPNAYTKESLAIEFMKNGITNERKILRMVEDVNTFCPCIKRNINEMDGRTHFSIVERFSETDLDNMYKRANNASLLYIFLKAIFIKPVTTEEVMEKVNVSKKAANQMLENILDASYILDDLETENGRIIGNTKFFD